jgi:hypothetical protein
MGLGGAGEYKTDVFAVTFLVQVQQFRDIRNMKRESLAN